MIKFFPLEDNVLVAAKKRIKNSFSNNVGVVLSLSGGKDSIVLCDLVYKMCKTGEIDKSLLEVVFVDEEAVYPSVEKVMKDWRVKWLSIGVKFTWFAIQCKHFNCFNQLQNDETFICWDETKRDSWVRPMPEFAVTGHPYFYPREETYQSFLKKYCASRIALVGIRVSESFRRRNAIATAKGNNYFYPIYDWFDSDIWLYIKENKLDFPDAYMFMYQIGITKKFLRISQFFSVDTAKSLVQMTEFYPDLFNKILKREPNAYLATLYFDTEMFRKSQKGKVGGIIQEEGDEQIVADSKYYKQEAFKLLNDDSAFTTPTQKKTQRKLKSFLMKFGVQIEGLREAHKYRIYKGAYDTAYGGDPKERSYQALINQLFSFMKMEETRKQQ